MKLDLLNNLINAVKESDFIQEFINELGDYLSNLEKDSTDKLSNQEKTKGSFTTVEEMIEKYNLNRASSRELREKRDEILQEYVKNSQKEDLYYVTYKNINNDTYTITQYNEEGKNDSLYISGKDLPDKVQEDLVLIKENGKFIIDEETTKIISDKVLIVAENMSNKQNTKIDNLREEDCLYQVVGLSEKGVFLQNKNNNMTFEETNISKDLKENLGNDYILRYKNGTYIFEKELTDEFFYSN